ncbi:developmental orphan receptor, putative [Ixodes scapularis]|uniref:Developmental orphan receptor, putative n=1 Tax=Ixodes scapularis TaxID=6945 RepID=B7Q195_IXOSC|nr:developmental orphan receptor, putative [Ixodes scapularis]|eukprot:XP_002409132.1 developmental orphan receptor, putative [Ixodes scapularis]
MGMRADSVQSERKPSTDSSLRAEKGAGLRSLLEKLPARLQFHFPLCQSSSGEARPLPKALCKVSDKGALRIQDPEHPRGRHIGSDVFVRGYRGNVIVDRQKNAELDSVWRRVGEVTQLLPEISNVVVIVDFCRSHCLIFQAKSHLTEAIGTVGPQLSAYTQLGEQLSHHTLFVEGLEHCRSRLSPPPSNSWGPLVSEELVPFRLTLPESPPGGALNVHYVCESASRLLFRSLHWARSLPAFEELPMSLQLTLVRSAWSELFTLGLAQCAEQLSLPALLSALASHLRTASPKNGGSGTSQRGLVAEHVATLQRLVGALQRLRLDDREYALLRVMVLFCPDRPGVERSWCGRLEQLQERACQELRARSGPDWEQRLPRLLLRLSAVRSLRPALTEELFFAGLIGSVRIDSILPYILRMEPHQMEPGALQEAAS